jgi:hypothetical protein
MKISCICSIKNEGDIIEAFVRLNGKICNSFFFVDDSTDNTREIIALLVEEGYDLNFLQKSEGGHNQPKPTRSYLSYVKKRINPDWIFLLDVDEIIVAPDKSKLLQEMQNVPPNTYLSAEWKTYAVTTLDYFSSKSPLSDCFGLCKVKGNTYRKASIPGQLANDISTTPGNHYASLLNGNQINEQFANSYYLAHFPVRSAEQIIVKNVIATHNLNTNIYAIYGEGMHVFPIFHMIRDKNYKLDLQDLANITVHYGNSELLPESIVAEAFNLQDNFLLKTELRYLNLAKINVIARLDSEIEILSMQIIKMKKESVGFKVKTKIKLLKDLISRTARTLLRK